MIVGVRDHQDLLRWEQRLGDAGIICAAFTEPDMGDEKTAIAVHPTADHDLFRNLRLL